MGKTKSKVRFGGVFHVECYGPDGKLKWREEATNLVVDEGLNHQLDILFDSDDSAVDLVDPWYIGLTGGDPTPAVDDTLDSHAGWSEVDAYSGNRKEFVDSRTDQSVDNSASKASFAINSDSTTIGGAFLCGAATGTSALLLCAAAFDGGNKSADDGDTLEVQYTYSAADDGT